jgi:hypothetical protein
LSSNFPIDRLVLLSAPEPFGISREKWTEKWWQWILAIPKPFNPASDATGSHCARNQQDPHIWFLAGTSGGIAKRQCTIPQKAILFPIINSIHFLAEPGFKSEADLEARVSGDEDGVIDMNVTIDSTQLSNLKKIRVHTAPFDVILPQDNLWGIKAGPTRAAADGYWVFLNSLSPGRHTVRFYGKDPDFETGVTYDLTVKSN